MMKPRICLEWGPNDIANLRDLVKELQHAIEKAPCLVAREGELTYECRHDRLCRVCAWRNETLEIMKHYESWRPNQAE